MHHYVHVVCVSVCLSEVLACIFSVCARLLLHVAIASHVACMFFSSYTVGYACIHYVWSRAWGLWTRLIINAYRV